MLLLSHTGKSSAIQYAAQDPLENLDFTDTIISKTTSSGLVKLLLNKKKGMILSPEVFNIVNKLLKSDEDATLPEMSSFSANSSRASTAHITSLQRKAE